MLPAIILQYKQRGIDRALSFKISFTPENETFSVFADEEKLLMILNNLITNSLKYSQENAVIDVLLDKTDTTHIAVRIKNKIRKEISPDISAVKQSFYHSRPLHTEGSGLGLWIANRLSEMIGFELSVSITDDVFETILMKKT